MPNWSINIPFICWKYLNQIKKSIKNTTYMLFFFLQRDFYYFSKLEKILNKCLQINNHTTDTLQTFN